MVVKSSRFLASYLFPLICLAQAPVLIDGPYVPSATLDRAMQNVVWTTDLQSCAMVKWGYSSGALNPSQGLTCNAGEVTAVQSAPIQGTTANTLIYYSPCSKPITGQLQFTVTTAGSGYVHSPTVTLTPQLGGAVANAEVDGSGHVALVVSNTQAYAGQSAPTVSLTATGGDTITIPAVVTAAVVPANPPYTCYGPYTFTSAAAGGAVPANPTAPAQVSTVTPAPQTSGTCGSGTGVCAVTASDPNAAGGLVAEYAAAACGDAVEIDPTTVPYIAGNSLAVFAAKPCTSSTPITIRTKGANSLFVNGRRTSPTDYPQMARIVNTAPTMELSSRNSDTPSTHTYLGTQPDCIPGSYYWWEGQANEPWEMYKCNNVSPKAITSIPSSGTLTLTVPGHRLTDGQHVVIKGVTGAGSSTVNSDWYATVVDSNTITLGAVVYGQSNQATGAASGGSVYTNAYQLLPYTSVTSAPTSCTAGEWFHYDGPGGAANEYQRTWYGSWNPFLNTCEVMPVRYDPYACSPLCGYNWPSQPPINMTQNVSDYVIFQGIAFDVMNIQADPQMLEFNIGQGGMGYNTYTGNVYGSFVNYGGHGLRYVNDLSNIPDPFYNNSGVGFQTAVKITSFGSLCNDCASVNSYFYGYQIFGGFWSSLDADSKVFYQATAETALLQNNFLSCGGICVYFSEDNATMLPVTDITINGNTFDTPDSYWQLSSPLIQQGVYFDRRHELEFKVGHRAAITGNIFNHGYVQDNNGAAICLCTQNQQYNFQSLTNNTAQFYLAGQQGNVTAGDLMAFSNTCGTTDHHIYTVSSSSGQNVVLNSVPSLNCTSAGVQAAARLGSPTSGITDVLVQNNSFLNNPEGIVFGFQAIFGGVGTSAIVEQSALRWKFLNNLFVQTDGSRISPLNTNGWYANCTAAASGNVMETGNAGGGQDIQIIHNTEIGRTNTCQSESAAWANQMFPVSGVGSGLTVRDNIVETLIPSAEAFSDSGTAGTAMFTQDWIGTTPQYNYPSNVIMRSGGAGSTPYPTGTNWFNGVYTAFPFWNPASDWHVLSTSIYTSGGSTNASDGLSQGADIDVLNAAQGAVLNVRALKISGAWNISFFAPNTAGCPVEWSTSSTLASPTLVSNAGGSRIQNVPLSGLPGIGTEVYYRVDCPVPVTGSFVVN